MGNRSEQGNNRKTTCVSLSVFMA